MQHVTGQVCTCPQTIYNPFEEGGFISSLVINTVLYINALKCESFACSAFCHENPETQPVNLTRKRAQNIQKSTAYHVNATANHRD